MIIQPHSLEGKNSQKVNHWDVIYEDEDMS